jgi:hypothetical protein
VPPLALQACTHVEIVKPDLTLKKIKESGRKCVPGRRGV